MELHAPPAGRKGMICGSVGACGPYRVWQSAPDLGSLVCVYDTDGQQLLSLTVCSDTNAFCNRQEECVSGGLKIDTRALCDLTQLTAACPAADAGIPGK
jgi:hypothetical protein